MHPAWQLAERPQLLEALSFQGEMTKALLEENMQLRDALEMLLDEQNHPPLETRAAQWLAACEAARIALGRP